MRPGAGPENPKPKTQNSKPRINNPEHKSAAEIQINNGGICRDDNKGSHFLMHSDKKINF